MNIIEELKRLSKIYNNYFNLKPHYMGKEYDVGLKHGYEIAWEQVYSIITLYEHNEKLLAYDKILENLKKGWKIPVKETNKMIEILEYVRGKIK